MSHAGSLTGEWCENGGPYVCYPPIDNKNTEYVCTDGTRINKADGKIIEFITQQTVHYYSDGFKNGKTRPKLVKDVFKRSSDSGTDSYVLIRSNRDKKQHRELTLRDDTLQLTFRKTSGNADEAAMIGKINYQRCSDAPEKKSFYTALIDCGGTGNYITGVPAVVNNPLVWDLGQSGIADKSRCKVAAKCWGGGWVAYARSEQDGNSKKEAFGAACGTENRHEAKQQAINSCRESGGTNCLAKVVSGFDDGSNELDDSTHKGNYIEYCSEGNCQLMSSE